MRSHCPPAVRDSLGSPNFRGIQLCQIVVPVLGGKEACLNARVCVQDIIEIHKLQLKGKQPWVVVEIGLSEDGV